MASQNSIAAPAGYVPQIAVSFGEGNAQSVSRDQPLPVRGAETSLAERLAREGTQLTNSYVRGDNASRAYSVGDTLGYFSPSIGRASWIESITVSSTRDVVIRIQRLDSKLNANGAGPAIHQLLVGPSYGATAIVPVQSFLNEGEAYSFVLRTAVEQSAAADFSFFCGLHGRHVANDFFMEAPRTMLVLGDSISTTTMLGADACGRNFYHARIAAKLRGEGKAIRRIVKGDGGWKASHAVTAMERGQLDCGALDAIMVMLGTNDVSSVEFGANLATLIDWKKAFAPKAPMIILGPPSRADAAESEYLVPIRDAAALIVAQLADPLVQFVDCSEAFDPNGQNLPDQVHLSAAAHEALAEHIEAELKAGGIWSKI